MPQPFHVSGAAARPLLHTDRAGINLIRTIFYDAFSLIDSTGAERVLTRWNLVSTVFPHLLDLFWSLRHYTRIFFTSAVTIKAGDELYFQVFNWLVERESRRYFIKEYSAHTLSDARSKSHDPRRRRGPTQREPKSEASQIKFTPAFKTTWFFYGWNLFAILRNDKHSARKDAPGEIPSFDFFGPMHAPKARDSVTITCLGWSIAPIRALLETCREMAEAQKQTSVTILSSREGHWSVSAVKPVRPLDTVYLNDDVKKNLMSDLEKYLDPKRRQFYSDNGIPYRRGYLLHGPPGCGKSSLSLALAGYFGLDLYIVNFGSIHEYELASLFAMLPARCFVLLEDIDAVGFRQKDDEDEDENENNKPRFPGRSRQKCSFSGLLNVLDGIASQEGRVVIMTSNFPDKLDEALVRPGRIDVKVYMGYMTRQGAEQIFLRMMKTGRLDMASGEFSENDNPEHTKARKRTVIAEDGQQVDEHQTDEELQLLAEKFSKLVPEETFTPAQLQGYLLRYLHSATTAVDKIAEWAVAEQRRVEDAAQRKKKKAKNAEKRKAEVMAKGEATSEDAGRASRLGSSPIYLPAPVSGSSIMAAMAKMTLEGESSPDSSEIDRIFGMGDESNTPESRE